MLKNRIHSEGNKRRYFVALLYAAGNARLRCAGKYHASESARSGRSTYRKKHKATCHCGSVEIELDLPEDLVDVRRCDCSLCRRRGVIAASVPPSGIRILRGEANLKLYQFNTKTAKHYFCSECGIYTHHQRRSNLNQYGFNVACLEGINPQKIEGIPTYDGVNHPADKAESM